MRENQRGIRKENTELLSLSLYFSVKILQNVIMAGRDKRVVRLVTAGEITDLPSKLAFFIIIIFTIIFFKKKI